MYSSCERNSSTASLVRCTSATSLLTTTIFSTLPEPIICSTAFQLVGIICSLDPKIEIAKMAVSTAI